MHALILTSMPLFFQEVCSVQAQVITHPVVILHNMKQNFYVALENFLYRALCVNQILIGS
jgi:hypothetical protein